MNLVLNDILLMIDKVKDAELDTFEYQDLDVKLKIKGKRVEPTYEKLNRSKLAQRREDDIKINSSMCNIVQNKQICNNSDKESFVSQEDFTVTEIFDHIEAPLVGTFYHAPSEGADPFVSVGDRVKKGQVIGIIEAMKLMNEVQSEVEGTVEEILVPNETLVEFGQKLIRVRPQ